MPLFATKPLDRIMAEAEAGHSLKRTLGPFSLIALGIGAIIGAQASSPRVQSASQSFPGRGNVDALLML